MKAMKKATRLLRLMIFYIVSLVVITLVDGFFVMRSIVKVYDLKEYLNGLTSPIEIFDNLLLLSTQYNPSRKKVADFLLNSVQEALQRYGQAFVYTQIFNIIVLSVIVYMVYKYRMKVKEYAEAVEEYDEKLQVDSDTDSDTSMEENK